MNGTKHGQQQHRDSRQRQKTPAVGRATVSAAGVLRARDLERQHGLSRTQIRRLSARGELVQHARGIYAAPDAPVTEHHTLVEVALRVPRAVICLTSALRFHDLTTQSPWRVHILLPVGAWTPRLDMVELVVFRTGQPEALVDGVETHLLEGVPVRVTSVARTVADCFKWRGRLGLDIALEALKECLREKRATPEEIRRFAAMNRVEKVMRPYMEAVLA